MYWKTNIKMDVEENALFVFGKTHRAEIETPTINRLSEFLNLSFGLKTIGKTHC